MYTFPGMRHSLISSFSLAYHNLTTEDIEGGLAKDLEVETEKTCFENEGIVVNCHF